MLLKIPGAMVIGAAVATAILNLTTEYAYMPILGKIAAQICAGAFIACTITKNDLQQIIKNWRTPFLLVGAMLVLNLVSGSILYALTDFDRVTCYMCMVPGGLSDVPIITEEIGGDPAIVLVAQFIRLIVGLVVFPLIAFHTREKKENTKEEKRDSQKRTSLQKKVWSSSHNIIDRNGWRSSFQEDRITKRRTLRVDDFCYHMEHGQREGLYVKGGSTSYPEPCRCIHRLFYRDREPSIIRRDSVKHVIGWFNLCCRMSRRGMDFVSFRTP